MVNVQVGDCVRYNKKRDNGGYVESAIYTVKETRIQNNSIELWFVGHYGWYSIEDFDIVTPAKPDIDYVQLAKEVSGNV